MNASKHDWHEFDVELGLQVRQATNRLRRNRWEVRHRDRTGRVIELTDEEFNDLRVKPEFVLSHHRGFLDG